MLSYAFSDLHKSGYEEIAGEEFENAHNLFATILSKGIGHILKRGMHREYINVNEDLITLRGKIDMTGTLRNRLSRKQAISCEYDELSENNLLNQILKTTAVLLIRHGQVYPKYKSDLKKVLLFFSNVDILEPTQIRWETIRFTRNNQIYRVLVSICQFVVEGMLLTTDDGLYKMDAFADEQRMSRLYEKFILEYYIKEHPVLNAKASQIPWALDDGIGTMLPTMQSDITLSCNNKILIIDAKYYSHTTQVQYDTHKVHSGNLYQIFTYVKNKTISVDALECQVSGMLLYAKTEDAVQPDNTYKMSGNIIHVRTLDLNQDFSEIAKQLNLIADLLQYS